MMAVVLQATGLHSQIQAYFGFWLGSCCRFRPGCLARGHRRRLRCDLLRSKSPPPRSRSRSGRTGTPTATPLLAGCWFGLGQKKLTNITKRKLWKHILNLHNNKHTVSIIYHLLYTSLLTGFLPPSVVIVTSYCTGGSHGPAGATVLWDVLVPGDAHIVLSLDVPPVPRRRKVRHLQVLMRPGLGPEERQGYSLYLVVVIQAV